ncbi:hypothetical protein OIDMADRAFT_30900 [Oidiodendron maius Zn]|uniref:Uncharacterized protein n=1 Tax=Oidiodendron maius (strain Zn) TaxID=913774 RepID=A0A0C3H7Q3_OIDMZ|nr:hypothetical protein OIDMADRAFT_30900 [Oidiodendron maius Zn]
MADMSRAASNQEEPSSDAAPSGSVVGPQAGSEETLDVEILGELKDALEMMSSSAWRNNLYQMEPTDPRRKTFREGALIAFNHAFLRTKSLPYLDLTISFAEELVAEFPDTLTYHTMLITFFKEKESLTKAAEDLDKYIRSVEAAISIAPDGPQKREWQSSLQLAHYYRSSSGFSVLDPDKLIATMMSLADINPDDGEKQIQSGWTMLKRYEKDGKVADLITSIKLQEDGLKKLADDDPSHWNAICTLTECYLHLYKREYNPRALDRAIDCMEERATIHLQNSVRAEFRNDRLAYLHMLKFFRKPNSSDLYSALLNYLRRIDSANRVPAKGLDEPDKPKSSLLKKLVYQSLGDSRSNFRLIELMTGVIDSEVTCTLREYTFHESPEYEVISPSNL